MITVYELLGHSYGVPESRAAQLSDALESSRELGFLGPGPATDHVQQALLTVSLVRSPGRVLDLGSGGGIPGLVVALALPEVELVLLDAMAKRCDFLQSTVAELDLGDRVTIECGRAEVLARREDLRASCHAVTSRSFGAPAVTAECAAGFLVVGGQLLVSEPPEDQPERWPAEPLAQLGLKATARHARDGASIMEIELVSPCPDEFPRRDGRPAKRPLWTN